MQCLYWLERGRLAGSCMPRTVGEVKELADVGIRRVVVLPESYEIAEVWDDAAAYFDALSLFDMDFIHEPVRDMGAPTPSQLRRILGWVKEGGSGPALVHCVAGLGRTGTVMAAWLISEHGYSVRKAIEAVRSLRPGSVQSYEQVSFISGIAPSRLDEDEKSDGPEA